MRGRLSPQKKKQKLKQDLVLIFLSLLLGVLFLKTGWAENLLRQSTGLEYVGIFLAGMLFTSVFTTAPATVILGEMSLAAGIPITALLGGLGALFGDFIIFKFFRSSLSQDMDLLLSKRNSDRFRHLMHSRFFRSFLTVLGAIIIASPLPDELGLAMMGVSKTKNLTFAFLSLFFNTLGIIAIGLVAKTLAS